MLPFFAPIQTPSDNLLINPLLVVQAQQIMSVIGRKDNPVWPGWDAKKTPILIYLPGKQDVLINHPKPPAGFSLYKGAIHSPLGAIWIKNGPTTLEFDGQNTSIDVNGVQTLVVADTLSTERQWIQGLQGNTDNLMENGLYPNPYPSMAIFAHEAFHVYQFKRGPGKGGIETDLTKYPSLSVENNVGFALESDFLAEAMEAKSTAEIRKDGIRWLTVRQWRRSKIPTEATAYEDGTEFNEGLAKYIEYRLLESLEGLKPVAEMWLVQGFKGLSDLRPQRQGYVRQMRGFMSGTMDVNNDLYGASPVRFRLYYSGMGVSTLLDRLGAKWKERVFQKSVSLTSLVEEALHATSEEKAAALAEIKASLRFRDLQSEKEKLAQDGERYVANALTALDNAPGELVIDYSKTADKPQFSFTPFGILRIDDNRAMFRLIPVRGEIGSLKFAEDGVRPILHDQILKQIRIPLTSLPGLVNGKPNLPGVTLTGTIPGIRVEGRRAILAL